MSIPADIVKLLGQLPPDTIPFVWKTIKQIHKSDDPKAAAMRAAEVTALVTGFDAEMRARARKAKRAKARGK